MTTRQGIVPKGVSLLLSALLIATPVANISAADDSRGGAATAALFVASDPSGASVYVDGQYVGSTPISIDRLSAGDHRLRVVKSGYLENGRIIRATAGKASTVEVKLTPDVSAPAAAQVIGSTGDGGVPKWVWWAAIGGGVAATAYVLATRNKAPNAGTISASPTTALQDATTVTFTSEGASDPDGDSLTYSWDFGDRTTGSGQSVQKVYSSSGTMNVTLTVSDGKKDATATTSITVRNLTATWRGSVGGAFNATLSINQSGTAVTGSYSDSDGFAATVSGTVRTTAPRVTFSINYGGGFIGTFSLEPNSDVNSLSGTYSEPGFGPAPTTLTRQ